MHEFHLKTGTRRMALLLACALVGVCLTGCFGEQPGSPTLGTSSGAVWSETMPGAEKIDLDVNTALNLCNALVAEAERTARQFTVGDLNRLKSILVQLNEYRYSDAPEYGYFFALREVYRTMYAYYVGNCEAGAIDGAVAAAQAAYEALPPSIRPEYLPPNGEAVHLTVANMEALAASKTH